MEDKHTDDRLREIAGQLAGMEVHALAPAYTGANSRIFRVETSKGPFALKNYPTRPGDSRSRAEIEWKALQFLHVRCGEVVPRPIARDAAGRFLLMEWIEGAPLKVHEPADVVHATEFIGRVFAQSADAEAAEFPPASEACLSASIIVGQIEQRLAALAPEPALDRFLRDAFLPALATARRDIPAAEPELAPALRRLIPSDFGFHNAIRQVDGRVRYIDFDYFGWDDPVKVAADFLLHPAMRLSADDKRAFVTAIAASLPGDSQFFQRLRARLPLYALRWIMILFNPFRLDRADELPSDAQERKGLLDDRMRKAGKLMEARDAELLARL
jgi:Ser/Thr protein kinase RdoA (MazF antagonist)